MAAAVLWFALSALFVDLVGYWLHRWSHRKGSPLYRPHMEHHVTNYPPARFFSEKYLSAGKNDLALWLAPFGILYAVAVLWLSLPHQAAILLGGATTALLSSILHDMTHIMDSLVWRNKLLLGIAVRHHAHHFKMGKNFGIITPLWDVIFGTRRVAPASRPERR